MFGRKKSATTSSHDAVMRQAIRDLRAHAGGFGVEDLRRYARAQYGVNLEYRAVWAAMRDGNY
ncbi:hypothetical protein [Streptomyces vinaceus]|uniref:hypothetical protein n=1 Tax=Streptomyces vinaceus TaxID=1960 RepID=UPI003693F9F3